METRNDKHVKGSGALESNTQRVIQIGSIAGDHGGNHHRIFFVEAQRTRKPFHGSRQREQTSARRLLPCREATLDRGTKRRTKDFYAVRIDRSRRCDALIEQVVRAAPDTGIAITLRHKQSRESANSLPAAERLWRRLALSLLRPADCEPDASFNRNLRVLSVVNNLNPGQTQINALCRLFGNRVLGALLQFSSHRSGRHHGSFNGAKQAVGQ